MTKDGKYEAALESARLLVQAVKEGAYNCDCQIGGVDAMSIDTDWLRLHVEKIYEYLKEIR